MRGIRKSRWFGKPDWPPAGDSPADSLSDLQTNDNALSVWRIEGDRSNLERAITAMAATRDIISNYDYILIDEQAVDGLGLQVKVEPGKTPDQAANLTWHRDVIHLTSSQICQLSQVLFSRAERARVTEKQVRDLLVAAIRDGTIRLDGLKPQLQQSLSKYLSNG
jgi:hypothetical protein